MADRKTTETSVKDFYADVLSEANRARLENARALEGIDEEIAMLRIRLRDMMAANPENVHLIFKGMEMLSKTVSTRYKLSPKSQNDLTDSIAGVINGIGRELFPEGM